MERLLLVRWIGAIHTHFLLDYFGVVHGVRIHHVLMFDIDLYCGVTISISIAIIVLTIFEFEER